jgi:antitoxin component of MazEF toxin-antitoxin module
MKERIQKRGNRLALRMKATAEGSNLRESSPVAATGRTVVAIEEPQLSFEDLIAQITPQNCHSEVRTGKAVGREVW